jgi:glycosyltransferase involved in cell wall biosynthesis
VIETASDNTSRAGHNLEQKQPGQKAGVRPEINVELFTGGFDRPYAIGLVTALASKNIFVGVIGTDQMDCQEWHASPFITFCNLQGNKHPSAGTAEKVFRVLRYYARLLAYAALSDADLFHILWNAEFQLFDRTALMLYYRMIGKKIVLTAHNVNAGKRDSNDSWLNRITLRTQYRLADHIFVHTEKMKQDLIEDFGVAENAVSVVPFGINNTAPQTSLGVREAKQRLGICDNERTILFFGSIRPYKGLAFLTEAFRKLVTEDDRYRLIIAGNPKKGCEDYVAQIQREIEDEDLRGRVVLNLGFIPDDETELYFKAADVVALPYTHVFQSGVLFLAYSFGLPVVATDVGSFRQDILEGETGFLCMPCDALELANTISKYFESDLFKTRECQRDWIREYANRTHSWDTVGEITRTEYLELLSK